MVTSSGRAPSAMKVAAAFAIVYIVWGSTYFFIRLSVAHIPPMLVGCLRFLLAGILMLLWCLFTKETVFSWRVIRPAIVSGVLLLFFGNGALIWSEQYIPSSLAAILLAAGPIWFVVLDKGKWKENFRSRATVAGLAVGSIGVLLLFGERLMGGAGDGAGRDGAAAVHAAAVHAAVGPAGVAGIPAGAAGIPASAVAGGAAHNWPMIALIVLVIGSISWAAGSLYSKYRSTGNSNSVNAGWQMLAAGVCFIPASLISGEWSHLQWSAVPLSSWLAIGYLVTMGSLAGYSAFVWLLQVRPATQVSTHAYVNPVVAVLLGVLFAGERLSFIQLLGLIVILASVLLINLAKYRAAGRAASEGDGRSGKMYKLYREKDIVHE
jgi:drug/metabolite transporter (DMT)-like permease